MRAAARRDANEPSIIRALEAVGWLVVPLSGAGLPDLLCVRRGALVLLEVKTAKGTVTTAQAGLFGRMLRWGYRVPVVRSPEEALAAAEEVAAKRAT